MILFFWILILLPACNEKTKYVQPELGSRALELLEVDGFQFKDLNKNEVLDSYEDWRLTTDERVADLLSQMTLEEKVGFMLISTINMAGSSMRPVPGAPRQKITSYLSEEETVMDQNFFTRKPLPIPAL
ncbi:MAG: glycoside hydrolase family 3 protein, partial [Calditrichae bacterium]|nr:glycoside hydrolase family 3 protein [Calditrichia bacterium]